MIDVRRLKAVELFDVSPVTFAAYPQTSVGVRALFPNGVPAEIRANSPTLKGLLAEARASGRSVAECQCQCAACSDSDCEECYEESCDDEVCRAEGCPMQTMVLML
jgi:hypothetical protein